ncbi:SMP-30/gluconolactonase/LRE family protein [Gordonia sp. TBRC 11910]|uniref:SMP-30/gluconolactonase/LRE family protein n=1 Tax=Gordonia asplenii TaxID=2725283 RepID=A0A848L5I8_9ACTN|nr:SMP-30/gluconolactonase/LRE family protein [Gordonia asplenii]NMO03821.1 SMP-30/gluconolactonase/LRE family protein [Gordonia asplenii]
MSYELEVLAEDLAFGEGPRWHNGALYLSDIHADRVIRMQPDGKYDVIGSFEGPTSGLGWLPDGAMLVVSMNDRRVLRQEPDGRFVEHADLSEVASWHANDMVVASDGRAYVGNFGFPIFPTIQSPRSTAIAMVTPDGQVVTAADDFWFPNGMVLTPDEGTLIVAESAARVLTALDVEPDGRLTNRRVWAALDGDRLPDGVCLDEDGAVWVASPPTREVLRVEEGGEILARIETEQEAIACMLGGNDRRTLFILTAEKQDPEWCRANRVAKVLSTRVEVAGAGRP